MSPINNNSNNNNNNGGFDDVSDDIDSGNRYDKRI